MLFQAHSPPSHPNNLSIPTCLVFPILRRGGSRSPRFRSRGFILPSTISPLKRCRMVDPMILSLDHEESHGMGKRRKHRVSQEKRKANTSCDVSKGNQRSTHAKITMNIKHRKNDLAEKTDKNATKKPGLTTCLQPKCAMDFFKALSVAVSTKSSNRSIAAVKSSP